MAYIFYSGGPCDKLDTCECLVPRDTVLRISVTLDYAVKLSKFNINQKTYTKKNAPYGQQYTYSDLDDGIVYTVDQSDNTVTAIDYWPAAKDCQTILNIRGAKIQQNVWRGLTPLHSMRDEVERLLGPPKDSVDQTFIYQTQLEIVHASYSKGACKTKEIGQWNVPTGVVLRIKVYPRTTTLIRDLQLNMNRYKRSPDPNLPNRFFYLNNEDGIMIESELQDGCEEAVAITYEPTIKDNELRCRPNSNATDRYNSPMSLIIAWGAQYGD